MADNDALKEVYELSLLFDFYGELLGEHKKQIFEDYVLNDLSLGEIAETAGISRQGVHDIIKRCTRSLHEYEDKLKLVQKFETVKEKVSSIKELAGRLEENDVTRRISDAATEIIEEL